MGLTEFGGDLLDIIGDFSGFVHDIDEGGALGADDKSEFDVIFFLFVFIINEETDGGGLLCKDGGKKEEKGNKDM